MIKRITPNIYIDNCKEAIEYYKELFGGEIKNVQLADGIDMFKGYEGKIIHSELHINENCVIYFVDKLDPQKAVSNPELILELDSKDEMDRLYSKLCEKGTIGFELQKTFWGAYHAIVTDPYGISWSLNYSEK